LYWYEDAYIKLKDNYNNRVLSKFPWIVQHCSMTLITNNESPVAEAEGPNTTADSHPVAEQDFNVLSFSTAQQRFHITNENCGYHAHTFSPAARRTTSAV
jgi:hypothetical protein